MHSTNLFRDQTGGILQGIYWNQAKQTSEKKRKIVQKSLPTGLFFTITFVWIVIICCWPRLEWEYCVCSCCPTLNPSNLSCYTLFSLIIPHTLQVSTLKDVTIHWIPRMSCSFMTWQGVDVKRVQFPVRRCFDVTVQRSQGQTLNRIVFYGCRDVFMHGCLYVGLSRVRKSADIRILTTEGRICPYTPCAKTVNVVYSSLIPELVD